MFSELLRETNRVPPVNHLEFQPFYLTPEGVDLNTQPPAAAHFLHAADGNLSHSSDEGELNFYFNLSDGERSQEFDQERIMADQAQREAMRHIDAAKRVYKTLQPTPFPSNELEVIPWVSNYEEYIQRVYGEDDVFKVEHLITHVPPKVYNFVRAMDQRAEIKRYN